MKTIGQLLIVGAVFLTTVGTGATWDAAEVRKTIEARGDAVVTVQLVLEMTSTYEGSSYKRQTKVNATGTLIDPSGLTVASLSQLNPSDMYSRMMGDDSEYKVSSNIASANLRLTDGTEIPMDIVLRDPDLDLAFLKPKKAPQKPLPYLDLGQSGSPDVLDEVLVLTRLGAAASRALSVTVDRIRAVISKPRKFYLINPNAHTSIGGPALTVDGKVAGITTLRFSTGAEPSAFSRGGTEDVVAYVILPSATVADIAQKAKKATPVKDSAPAVKPAQKPAGAK